MKALGNGVMLCMVPLSPYIWEWQKSQTPQEMEIYISSSTCLPPPPLKADTKQLPVPINSSRQVEARALNVTPL